MDLATLAAAVLRPGAPVGLRDERIAVSLRLIGSLLDGRARLAEGSPQLVLAASGTLRTARNESSRTAGQAAAFETPVLDPREPGSTAARLAARVAGSGVFFEAHVAQWLRGDRSIEAVQSEALQLARAVLADPARAETRASLQLEALHRETITLSGPAWAGQAMLLELGRDPQVLPDGANGAGETTQQVFVARLRMDLPRLGAIEIHLRLAGESIAATIEAGGATAS